MAPNVYTRQPGKRTRRRKRQQWQLILLLALLLIALAFCITKVIEMFDKDPNSQGGQGTSQTSTWGESSSSAPDSSSSNSSSQPASGGNYRYTFGEEKIPDGGYWKIPENVEATTQQTLVYANAKMLALPENGKVMTSYFDDATFVGDSLTQGIQQYNMFPNSNFCAFKGISPQGFMGLQTLPDGTTAVPMDLIQAVGSSKIYVLLGTNAMTFMSDEAFLTYYDQFMTELAARMPHAQIYIQSITPTTAEKGADAHFTLERIANLNNAIAGLAYNHGFHYLDINSALSGDDGYAIPELIYASDGYHFRPEGYTVWKEYLMTHTAHLTGNQYQYGSPHY